MNYLRHDRFPHPRSPSPKGRGVRSEAMLIHINFDKETSDVTTH